MTSFALKNDRLLQVALDNEEILATAGSMVACSGNIKFEKALLGGEGLFGVLKRKVTTEQFELMCVKGSGIVYFANKAQEISILPLNNEKVFIESNSLLAFDKNLKTNVAFAGIAGATSGQGLFTTTVEGIGHVAVISQGGILAFEVNGIYPFCVDPDAFIGYQGNVQKEFIFDVNWKTMIGENSGESYQLKFTGQGIVYIQAAERPRPKS
ncbi:MULTISPECIES: AIM24 family protein [Spirulina sp. CCY15215]|uniref:AIM24 family protein n=1 Tax=Spirulina sp. CCY15215 TaxID=2767591 RepID=UPI0019516CE9|nr:AIM24 family protein [Spirulina major]